MGITGFAKFIEETFPNVIQVTSIRSLDIKGKVAVDGFNECYMQMYVTRSSVVKNMSMGEIYDYYRGKEFRNEFVQKVRKIWINRILDFIMTDLKSQVVWVFDGDNVPQNKDETRLERRERLEKTRTEMGTAMDSFEKDEFPNPQYYRKTFTDYILNRPPSWEDYQILSTVLVNMGIPVVKAWGEGEKTCARLCIRDLTPDPDLYCWAVWSADVDSVLFGAPVLLQRKRSYGGGQPVDYSQDSGSVRVFHAAKLPIELDKLIQVCVATGCDYLPKGIPGLGLKKAYKLFGQPDAITPFPHEHSHVLDLFKHDPTQETVTVLKPEDHQDRLTDPVVKWFLTIYSQTK
jgi:5'-3' exonuclease